MGGDKGKGEGEGEGEELGGRGLGGRGLFCLAKRVGRKCAGWLCASGEGTALVERRGEVRR